MFPIPHNGRELTPGELGCYASHIRVMQRIAKSDSPFALVLESDAQPSAQSFRIIDNIAAGTDDWELLMLNWSACLPSFWQRSALIEGFQKVRFARKSYHAAAYLLTPSGARKILAHAFPIVMPVDDLMTGGKVDKGISTFATFPCAVVLSDHYLVSSTILDEEREAIERGKTSKKPRNRIKRWEMALRAWWYRIKRPPQI